MDQRASPLGNRHCFVTVGSIASFRLLLSEVLQPQFLKALVDHGFNVLEVQCGPDRDWFLQQRDQLPETAKQLDLAIHSFDYTTDMKNKMLQCRGLHQVRGAGCVISHAGAGTVMEAIRYQVPLVVVPNSTLMDNHQAELADECEKEGWAIHGKLGTLYTAIQASREQVIQGRLDELPSYAEPTFPVPEDQRITTFDWMVLTCYPEELKRQSHLNEIRKPLGQESRETRSAMGELRDVAGLQMD